MPRLASTTQGPARIVADAIEVLDVPYADLGEALAAGADLAELAAAPERPALATPVVLAPVPRPPKVWAVGWAYRAHREESAAVGDHEDPFFFLKAPSSVIGHGADIRLPAVAPDRVDYEGELAVVIGHGGSDISELAALEHVAGFTIANDVSARDVQKGEVAGRAANVNLGKSFDTFTPMGPWLTTLDELDDPDDLLLRTTVDGEIRQEARTSDLLYGVAAQVSYISRYTSLEPGDVILTGTPSGVGFPEGRFLRDGSVVTVEIEGLGTLENHVSATPARQQEGQDV